MLLLYMLTVGKVHGAVPADLMAGVSWWNRFKLVPIHYYTVLRLSRTLRLGEIYLRRRSTRWMAAWALICLFEWEGENLCLIFGRSSLSFSFHRIRNHLYRTRVPWWGFRLAVSIYSFSVYPFPMTKEIWLIYYCLFSKTYEEIKQQISIKPCGVGKLLLSAPG